MTAPADSVPSIARRERFQRVMLYTLLIIGALLALLPMLWMLSASLMPRVATVEESPSIRLPAYGGAGLARQGVTPYLRGVGGPC